MLQFKEFKEIFRVQVQDPFNYTPPHLDGSSSGQRLARTGTSRLLKWSNIELMATLSSPIDKWKGPQRGKQLVYTETLKGPHLFVVFVRYTQMPYNLLTTVTQNCSLVFLIHNAFPKQKCRARISTAELFQGPCFTKVRLVVKRLLRCPRHWVHSPGPCNNAF